MTPRKAIYTEAELKARQSSQHQRYNKENTTTINIRLAPEDKVIYEQYASWKGLPLARMFRQCAEACMRLDGWTYQPEGGTETEDQPGERAEEQAQ